MSARDAGDPGVSDEQLFDALLDRELDEQTRREMLRDLRHRPGQRDELAETAEIIGQLHTPVVPPDLTASVLRETERRRRFLSSRLRRFVSAGRVVAGCVVLAFVLTVALVQRTAPGTLSFRVRPTPGLPWIRRLA